VYIVRLGSQACLVLSRYWKYLKMPTHKIRNNAERPRSVLQGEHAYESILWTLSFTSSLTSDGRLVRR